MTDQNFETFFQAFIDSALWCETNEYGISLSSKYDIDDIDYKDFEKLEKMCLEFFNKNNRLFLEDCDQAGHDFYLTINGHGCGFWDGDWPEPSATILTRECESYPEVHLYFGDEESSDCECQTIYVFMG